LHQIGAAGAGIVPLNYADGQIKKKTLILQVLRSLAKARNKLNFRDLEFLDIYTNHDMCLAIIWFLSLPKVICIDLIFRKSGQKKAEPNRGIQVLSLAKAR
ncbi:hypothetical protein ACJX0J_031648, partial [Zea mays]